MIREVFINSLPRGSAQKSTEFAKMTSIIVQAANNVFLKIFEEEILPERDIDNPNWNPQITLQKWVQIFNIQAVLDSKSYEDDFINYIVRFYNRLLITRPSPISFQDLNKLFEEYSDLGLHIDFTESFIIGVNRLGDGFGLGNIAEYAVLSVDLSKKYGENFSTLIQLIQRVLFINSKLVTNIPFSFGEYYPSYEDFIIIHDCELNYYYWNGVRYIPTGNYQINKNSNVTLAQRNFIVDKIINFPLKGIYDTLNFLPQEEENIFVLGESRLGDGTVLGIISNISVIYLSFFILNIDSKSIVATISFINRIDSNIISYMFDLKNINVDLWTAVLLQKNRVPANYEPYELLIESDGSFYIDQVRMNVNNDKNHKSYPLNISKTIETKIVTDNKQKYMENIYENIS